MRDQGTSDGRGVGLGPAEKSLKSAFLLSEVGHLRTSQRSRIRSHAGWLPEAARLVLLPSCKRASGLGADWRQVPSFSQQLLRTRKLRSEPENPEAVNQSGFV